MSGASESMEYEVKVPVKNAHEVIERLKSLLGRDPDTQVIEEDYYVDFSKCPGLPKGTAFRIRKTLDHSGRLLEGRVTFKKLPSAPTPREAKVRVEVETGVEDPDALIRSFTMMGFPLIMVRKRRITYRLDRDVTVSVDTVEGLGTYVEIEVINPPSSEYYNKRLEEVLKVLGLKPERLETRPYIWLIQEEMMSG